MGKKAKSHDYKELNFDKAGKISQYTATAASTGTIGLTATQQINQENGFYAFGVIHAIGTTMALIALIHEMVQAVLDRRHFSIRRSLYMFFSLASLAIDYTVASLAIYCANQRKFDGPEANTAIALFAFSIFVKGTLQAKNTKSKSNEPEPAPSKDKAKNDTEAGSPDESEDDQSDHEHDVEAGKSIRMRKVGS